MPKVYVITKNGDFTEGRGPMRFQTVKSTLEKAKAYANNEPHGVAGATPPPGMTLADRCMSGKGGGWGGFEILEIEMD